MTADAGDLAYPDTDATRVARPGYVFTWINEQFIGEQPWHETNFKFDPGRHLIPPLEPERTFTFEVPWEVGLPWTDVRDQAVINHRHWVPVSRELLRDAGWFPWETPHRNPMPHIVLFPRLAHATTRARRARDRVRDALHVLRHGLPEPEPDDDAW